MLTQTYINSLIFKILKLVLHHLLYDVTINIKTDVYDGLKLIEDHEKNQGEIE